MCVKLCIHNLPQVQPQPSKSPRKTPPQTQVTKFHRRIEHGPPRSGSLGSLLRDLRRLGERRSSISCSGTLRQGPPKLSYRRDPSGSSVICTLYVSVRFKISSLLSFGICLYKWASKTKMYTCLKCLFQAYDNAPVTRL